jgi:hypothetical protein
VNCKNGSIDDLTIYSYYDCCGILVEGTASGTELICYDANQPNSGVIDGVSSCSVICVTPTPTPTNTATPAATPTPTNTSTPASTPTRTPASTLTPTITPTSNDKWLARLCCNIDITGIVKSPAVSIGSIFVDNFDNCWEVIDYAVDTASITYSSGGGADCKACTDTYGCNWEAQCCTTSATIIVNDLSLPPLVVNQSIVAFSNNVCYRLTGKVIGPPNDTILTTYTGCDDCISSGNHDPCP